MTVSVQDVMVEDEYKHFRHLCREICSEAQRLNLPQGLVFSGVAWNFPAMFRIKVDKIVERLIGDA